MGGICPNTDDQDAFWLHETINAASHLHQERHKQFIKSLSGITKDSLLFRGSSTCRCQDLVYKYLKWRFNSNNIHFTKQTQNSLNTVQEIIYRSISYRSVFLCIKLDYIPTNLVGNYLLLHINLITFLTFKLLQHIFEPWSSQKP